MNDFKNRIDNLTDTDILAGMANLFEIKLTGFKNLENMAKRVPSVLRGKIISTIKTTKVSDIDSVEGYEELKNSKEILFWKTIIVNLYNGVNYNVAELYLLSKYDEDEKFKKFNDVLLSETEATANETEEPADIEVVEEDIIKPVETTAPVDITQVKKLQKENDGLKKDIARLEKRMEKNVNGYHALSEEKDKLEQKYKELKDKYDDLEKEYTVLKNSIKSSVILDKRQEEYYRKLFSAQNILMVNMKPQLGVPFPLSYSYIDVKAIFSDSLDAVKVSDVWIMKDTYSDIQMEAIISRLEGRYGSLNFREISKDQIEQMELEVIK